MSALDTLYERPDRVLHPLVGTEGYTLPPRETLAVYGMDAPSDVQAAREAHGLRLDVEPRKRNVLAIDHSVRAPKLHVKFSGSDNLGVLGSNAAASGSLQFLKDRGTVVVSGAASPRVMQLTVHLRSDEERFFFGRGGSCEGLAASMRGRAGVVIGDDCMLSWRVTFRPSDMHAIIDLATGTVINAAEDIVVEPHVWIGQEALILKGAHIGAGSIVGGKSVIVGGKLGIEGKEYVFRDGDVVHFRFNV